MRAAGRQPVGAVHPERIFPAQGRQVFGPNRVRVGRPARDQIDHRGEEGRLRAAQIVGAVPVRHVAVAVDQAGEVADHVEGQIATPALLQAEHREIGVPVVDLGEAPAGHDVGEGQRQERAVGRGGLGPALEHRPEPVDVVAHVLAGHRAIALALRPRQAEVARNERLADRSAGRSALLAVALQDRRRRVVRHGVGEGLAVREHALQLHVHEQLAIKLQRCFDLGRRGEPDSGLAGEPQADADAEGSA